MTGTHRIVGGALDDFAGRIIEMDDLAKKFVAAINEEEKASVIGEVETTVSKLGTRYVSLFPAFLHSVNISLFEDVARKCLVV